MRLPGGSTCRVLRQSGGLWPTSRVKLHRSAFKHGVLTEDAVQAADWSHRIEPLEDDDWPHRDLPLGFTFRTYARLRERLVPYLSEQARRTIDTDCPLLRGLFMQWPDDPDVWAHPSQFMLGDDLLVHPVSKPGATRWSTYLPEGRWIDVWDGTAHDGRAVVSRPVPSGVIPVYCQESSWSANRDAIFTAGRLALH